MRQSYFWTFLAIGLITSSQVFAGSDEKRVDETKRTLACVCGCGMTLETCQGAMSCGAADNMTSIIRKMVSQGKTKEQITAYFVNKYGEVVLAAPTKKGFNLTAWIFPFLGLLIGIWVVRTAIVKWVRKREESLASAPAQKTDEADSKYRRKLQEELKKFED